MWPCSKTYFIKSVDICNDKFSYGIRILLVCQILEVPCVMAVLNVAMFKDIFYKVSGHT